VCWGKGKGRGNGKRRWYCEKIIRTKDVELYVPGKIID